MKVRAQALWRWVVWLYRTRPVQAVVTVVQEIIWRYGRDDAGVLAAGLAFYAVISIAPLALFLVVLVGALISRETAQASLVELLREYVADETAAQVEAVLVNTQAPTFDSFTAFAAAGILAFGATRIFAQLHVILNRTFGVRTRALTVWEDIVLFLRKRLVAGGMVALLAALMLVSLLFNAAVGAAQQFLPGEIMARVPVQGTLNFVVATLVGGLMMALVYRVMPDAKLAWRDVLVGGLFTSVLFNLGQRTIEWYLAKETLGSSYGAAGSLVMLLLWLYYSSMIFLIGAEFTDTWARLYGKGVEPEWHAVAIPGHDRLEHERLTTRVMQLVDLAEDVSSEHEPPLRISTALEAVTDDTTKDVPPGTTAPLDLPAPLPNESHAVEIVDARTRRR